jgi:CheY-like chemotaxis protein
MVIYNINQHISRMLSQKKLSSATDFVYKRGDSTGMYQSIQSLICDGKTYELLRIIAFQHCNSQILLNKIKLTRKQYYLRILRLAETGLIRRRRSGEYYLTSFGRVIYKYTMGIENAVHNYWKLRALDSLETSYQLPIEERKKFIDNLIENSEIRDILIKNEWLYSSTNIGNRIETPRLVIEKQQLKKLSPKIMLVEDETDVLLTYKTTLNTEGYDVEAFTNPYEALKNFIAKKHPYYDLIIIDIGIPGINGLQLYQKFKSIDHLVKILFITALDAAPEIVSILPDVRLSDVIRKPVDQERLINVVKMAIA